MRTEQEIKDKIRKMKSSRGDYHELAGMEAALRWVIGEDTELLLHEDVIPPGQGVMGVTLQMDDSKSKHLKYGLETIGLLLVGMLYFLVPMIITCIPIVGTLYLYEEVNEWLMIPGLTITLIISFAFMSWYVEKTID